MKCPSCQEENELDSPFCNYCGTVITSSSIDKFPSPELGSESIPVVASLKKDQTAPPGHERTPPEVRQNTSANVVAGKPLVPSQPISTGQNFWVAPVVILIAGLAIFGGMVAFSSNSRNASSEIATDEVVVPPPELPAIPNDGVAQPESTPQPIEPEEILALEIDSFEIVRQTDTAFGSFIKLHIGAPSSLSLEIHVDRDVITDVSPGSDQVIFICRPTVLELVATNSDGKEASQTLKVDGGDQMQVEPSNRDAPYFGEIEAIIASSAICDYGTISSEDEDPLFAYTAQILEKANLESLSIYRNSLFAIQGFIFESHENGQIFQSRPWYDPVTFNADLLYSKLSPAQKQNIDYIKLKESENSN